jgi:hypothetical protein
MTDPIRQQIVVDAAVERALTVFTAQPGEGGWPVDGRRYADVVAA